ncbi:MAG: acylphosphatase [bacterium]|nr:acylphosphatase [bacterium]
MPEEKTSGKQARAHIKIHGKVQNVGFRFFIHRKAAGAGACGWAKNADGYVEAVLEGKKDKLEECIEACRKGPLFSSIEKVDVSWEKPTGEFKVFEVR